MDVDTFAIESFERVEGADDKSEKTGGVNGKPVSVSSRSRGDGGDNDSNCFDSLSADEDNLLILLFIIIMLCCYVILILWDIITMCILLI